MDLKDFTEASFDPKTWINTTTSNIEKEEEKEKCVTTLIAKLQVHFHQLNTEFEATGQKVVQNLPTVIKDAEKLSDDATDLQDKMNSVKEEIEKIKKNTGLTIASLEKIDKVKMELIKYKEAILEADKWTVLSNKIKAAIDARDIDTIISQVITMQQSLNVLSKAYDYEDKKMELDSFKNQLEAMASPLLLQAFTTKSIDQSRKYIQVFQDINRLPQLLKLYSQNQKSLLIQSWDVISEIESEENVVESLQSYYSVLLSTWQEQVKWCDSVFSETSGVEILIDLYKDLLTVLSPKFSTYMDNNLKQVSEPLVLLLDLKQCTQTFANNLKALINLYGDEKKLLNLAKAIYMPYKNHISKYGVYQEASLHPHLMSLTSTQGDIMESVQNLGHLNSKAFGYLDEANKFCVKLTESCGYPGFLKAVECFLNAYLNQYRLIKKDINENQKKHEEVNMFQVCLTVMQHIGNFINKFKQFEKECIANVIKAKDEYSKADIHPFFQYPVLLLDDSKQKDFNIMIKSLNEKNELTVLKSVFNTVKELCQDVYDTTYQVIFEPISVILSSLSSSSIWDTSKKSGGSFDLPDYSFVPQEYITQIGQYLMNMPQLLDPFLLSKNQELVLALSMVGSEYSALMDNTNEESGFAEIFLGEITKGTCKAYAKQILAIHELSSMMCKQLITDVNYLGNVLEDLGFSLSKKLQEITLLLKLSPSEYSTQSTGCSPQVVAAVRQMRNIISG